MSRWPQAADLCGPVPRDTDVVVVGGGIMGITLAYHLAGAGAEVLTVERGELNREASGTNAGSFHLQIAIHQLTGNDPKAEADRLADDVRLGAAAARHWRELDKELGGALDLHVTGGLMVAETPAEMRLLRDKQAIEKLGGLETHVLDGEELSSLAPYCASDLAGATWCPEEGHVNPLVAVPLLSRVAIDRGALVRARTEVTGVRYEPGSMSGRFLVQTTRGTVRAHRLVNAAGAWAGELAQLCGLRHPIWPGALHVNVTEPRAPLVPCLVQHIGRRLTLKQTSSGTFIIGGGWPAGGTDPGSPLRGRQPTLWGSAAGNAAVAVRVVPELADVMLLRTWAGVMAFTDDLVPVVGESSRMPGYYTLVLAAGFTLGPLVAQRLAEQMMGGPELPHGWSPDRAQLQPSVRG